jgi:DHA3 family macrolide efflux protein-like MFS transporter
MVYKLTGSAWLVSTIFIVNAIPNLVFGLISGVASNYFKKKQIVLICDIGRGLIAAVTAVLLFSGHLNLWYLYVFTFLNSTFESFRGPASTIFYIHVVPEQKMTYARALDSTMGKIVELLGLGAAGILIAWVDVSGVILIDAITFLLCGLIIQSISIKNEVLKKEKLTVNQCFTDLREGFEYLKSNKLIYYISIVASVFNFLFVPLSALSAVYIRDVLKGGSYVLSIFGIGFITGILVGSIFVPKLKEVFSGKSLFVGSSVVAAIGYISLSFIHQIGVPEIRFMAFGAIIFMIGLTMPVINIPISVAIMTRVEKEYIGRVVAIFNTIGLLCLPLGGLVAGTLTTIITIPQLFLGCGITLLVLALMQNMSKELKEL